VLEARRNCYANKVYYELGDQPDGLHTGAETPDAFVARMKAANVKELECLGDTEQAKVLGDLMDLTLKESTLLREKESECRKSKKCTEHRENLKAADSICSSIATARLAQNQMSAERANPSGVVNLAVLHDAGEMLQMSQAQVKEEKAEFRAKYKREFPESICKEVWAQPDQTSPDDPRTECDPYVGQGQPTSN
jgi:hypothetical protein